jgi:transcriptional regulator with XRE-family HTH domain
MSIAQRLKAARESAGLSQEHVAREIRVSVGTISRGERGQHVPEGATLAGLSKLYGRSADWLLHGDRADARETTVDRDDARSPYPDFEAALEAEGLIALAAANDSDALVIVKRVRGIRYAGGLAEADYAEALHQIARAKAALRGKAIVSKAEPLTTGSVPEGRRKVSSPTKKR